MKRLPAYAAVVLLALAAWLAGRPAGQAPAGSLPAPSGPGSHPGAPAADLPVKVYLPTVRLFHPGSGPFGIHGGSQVSADELTVIAAAGAAWTRDFGVSWASVWPDKDAGPQWDALNPTWERLRAAQGLGIRVIEVIYDTPLWARQIPDNGCGPIKPEFLSHFAWFVGEVARRARAAGVAVDAWELFNEPDVDRSGGPPLACYGRGADEYFGGGDYAGVLKAAYPALKAADPATPVLIGGLLLDCDPINPPPGKNCTPAKFLEGILRADGAPYFDGVSFHAYDYYTGTPGGYFNPNWHSFADETGPVVIAKAQFIARILVSYGATGKVLLNTESAVICGQTGTEAACLTDDFRQTKAAYLVQVMVVAAGLGLKANVWYSLGGWRASGLLGDEGALALQAFKFLSGFFQGASFAGRRDDLGPDVFGYEFVRPNGNRVWVLWSGPGKSPEVNLPANTVNIYDYVGNRLSHPGGKLVVSWRPTYVEFRP